MDLYGCGFNGHHQLSFSSPSGGPAEDICPLRKIVSGENLAVVFAGWSETVFILNGRLFAVGYGCHESIHIASSIDPFALKSWFGDHNGLIGALTKSGAILLLSRKPNLRLEQYGGHENTPISHLALAGNGAIAVAISSSTAPLNTHVLTFAKFEDFKWWYLHSALQSICSSKAAINHSPVRESDAASNDTWSESQASTSCRISNQQLPHQQYIIPGISPTQLVAGATFFVLLVSTGDVYTWGDARHSRTFARVVNPDSPANMPKIVDALGGLSIVKISAGGWVAAALSKDGAGYLWGGRAGAPTLRCLEENTEENNSTEVILLALESVEDVAEIAVGGAHIAVLSGDGRILTAGEGTNGQLGVFDCAFARDWVEVAAPRGKSIVGLQCGDRSTFVFVRGEANGG